jgi:hypothetical protein
MPPQDPLTEALRLTDEYRRAYTFEMEDARAALESHLRTHLSPRVALTEEQIEAATFAAHLAFYNFRQFSSFETALARKVEELHGIPAPPAGITDSTGTGSPTP